MGVCSFGRVSDSVHIICTIQHLPQRACSPWLTANPRAFRGVPLRRMLCLGGLSLQSVGSADGGLVLYCFSCGYVFCFSSVTCNTRGIIHA